MRKYQVLAAFLLAPLTPTFLAIAVGQWQEHLYDRAMNWGLLLWILMMNSLLAYPMAIVAGFAVYMATRGTAYAHWVVYTVIGVALGFLLASLFGQNIQGIQGVFLTPAHLYAMFFGGVSVLVFWLIARPDQYREDE